MKKTGVHRWTLEFPGNHCVDCGIGDPYEDKEMHAGSILERCPVNHEIPKYCEICGGAGMVVKKIPIPRCSGYMT